jgi:hypothetical protein
MRLLALMLAMHSSAADPYHYWNPDGAIIATIDWCGEWDDPSASHPRANNDETGPDCVEERTTDGLDDPSVSRNIKYPRGSMYRGSTDLEFMVDDYSKAGGLQKIGVRIQNVAVDAASLAGKQVHLMFEPTRPSSVNDAYNSHAPLSVTITAELIASAPAFADSWRYHSKYWPVDRFNLTNRARTTASVTWSMPETQSGTGGNNIFALTPDLTPLLAEVVSLPGWVPGNSVAFIFEIASGTGLRTFELERQVGLADASLVSRKSKKGVVASKTPALIVSSPGCADWCSKWTCAHEWCSGCGEEVCATNQCEGWCNTWTCSESVPFFVSRCGGCAACATATP